MGLFFGLFFLISLIFESTLIQIPLTLMGLIVFFIVKKHEDLFVIAFFLGLILDIMSFRQVGISSIFFVCILFLISLYERKYEIKTLPFVIISSAIGSLVYLLIDRAQHIFLLVCANVFLALVCFFIATRLIHTDKK